MYRASTGDLSVIDDPPRGGGRWDRDRFERAAGARRGLDEHDRFHFEEHDRRGRDRRDIEFDERYDRRGPRVMERERFVEEDRFGGPRHRRPQFLDEDSVSEVANRALAPYRRKSVVEKDIDFAPRRPARPQYIRRQSSLDTFDRRPMPRYGDKERDEWRPPTNVNIPLPIRERRRRRSPSHRSFREEDFETLGYRDSSPRGRDEYREIEIRREKSTRRRSRARSMAQSVRSSSTSSFEEVQVPIGRRGKTRMPKRLVKKQAVIEKGYPYEEEDDFIIVRRALEKEHIDELIKISENYKEEKTAYVYEDNKSVYEPPPAPIEHRHHAPSTYAGSVRTSSPSRHELSEDRVEESNHIHGPLTMFVPDERRIVRERDVREVRSERDVRAERDLKEEIRALEDERRMLKYEREGDFELVEKPRREVVRVEKDRRGRKPPNPKLVAAMMTTLT